MKQAYAATVVFNTVEGIEEVERFALSIIIDINPKKAEQRAIQTVQRNENNPRIRNVILLPLDIPRIQQELAKP